MAKVHVEGPLPYGKPEDLTSAIDSMLKGEAAISMDDIASMPEGAQRVMMQAQAQADIFTSGVAMLISNLYDAIPRVQSLLKDVWNIVNHRIVQVTMLPSNPVPHLSFVCAGKTKDELMGLILIPENYRKQFERDPLFILGGIVFVGSQTRDFYNGKINVENPKETADRARMYEAEYLLYIQQLGRPLNDYQLDVVAAFPKGLETRPELLYTPQPTPMAVDRTAPMEHS